MNEKEFDIQVRNLLLNAEEPVSQKVWEGVAAGLDKQRRVIPFRFWGYATAVAAAAAVALFVLLKPATTPVLEPAHSNPSIFMSEASGETVPEAEVAPVQEVAPVELVQSPRVKPHLLAQAQEPAAPEALPEAAPVAEKAPEAPAAQPAAQEVKTTPEEAAAQAQKANDNALLNQLAFEEKVARKASGGVSLMAFSNVQTSQRSGVHNNYRRYGAPSRNAGNGILYEGPETSFALPFSLGVGVQFNLTPRWAIGSGIRYTNLGRTFVGDYKDEPLVPYLSTDIDNHQHWLGVPVNVYYSFVNTSRWSVHAFAGASAEWLLDNHFLVHNSPSDIHYHQKGSFRNPQWSGTLGLGVEFKLTPYVGIYLDPSIRYFFATEKQPRSLRTVQPLRFDVEAGVRFSIGK